MWARVALASEFSEILRHMAGNFHGHQHLALGKSQQMWHEIGKIFLYAAEGNRKCLTLWWPGEWFTVKASPAPDPESLVPFPIPISIPKPNPNPHSTVTLIVCFWSPTKRGCCLTFSSAFPFSSLCFFFCFSGGPSFVRPLFYLLFVCFGSGEVCLAGEVFLWQSTVSVCVSGSG